MPVCSACGFEAESVFKFCPECGTPAGAPARPPGEERKVVTSLFCDLVGFTALSEAADPEDVDRMLEAYFSLVRAEIERHGGTVEKFIGDAVVGVFGVPAAHEDDPERAVRAGLRIVEDARELEALGGEPLRLRVGIDTGEALVRLGVSATSGEGFLVGDAINTASRLQSVAPVMGVVAGLPTYEATAAVFDWEELAPAVLKGKAEPVRVFRATSPRARLGTDLTRTHDSPFVGREHDLSLLKGVFDKTVAADAPHLVTVAGEPGLGKSRLVAELGAYVETGPARVTWLQGRCLPYGDGITFWALGEILKAHAGVLESDTADAAAAKLDPVIPDGPEREWFRQRLLPLLGVEAASPAQREELFTAWRRFLESIAEECPTVLVFEDLHWADEAMLAFVEHLADHAESVPLLVVGTARPELFERRPGYAAGIRNATAIGLSPLSPEDTARLVCGLLEAVAVPPALQQPIVERAGGNPLYAEELVRLLKDRGLLVRAGDGWALRDGAEVPFPDSVQALIAARLDTLAPEPKSMLADAAVVGKVFWAGAVAAMGERGLEAVLPALRELGRKELVRRERRSSLEGENEHAFWHVLTRDVAYSQLPRASRAARHVAAAAWIESRAGDRVGDQADVLAHHYATALDLALAGGQAELAAELEAPAFRFLSLAGERALGLDTAAALAWFERALALAPPGHPQRAQALSRFADAALQAGRTVEAAKALEEAVESFRDSGDLRAAAEAMTMLNRPLLRLADPRAFTLAQEAVAMLEPLPPCPELVAALTELAVTETVLHGRYADGAGHAERALALAAELGLGRPARTLGFRGLARSYERDPRGIDDLREAIAVATAAGQSREAATIHQNLGFVLYSAEGPAAALEVMRAGIALAEARGLTDSAENLRASMLDALVEVGELDEALRLAAAIVDRFDGEEALAVTIARAAAARILALRGRAEESTASLDRLESTGREVGADLLVIALASSAFGRAALGPSKHAAALLAEVEAASGARDSPNYSALLPAMVRTALAIGEQDLAGRLAGGLERGSPYAEHALVAAGAALTEARGDPEAAAGAYADAARRWRHFGVVAEEAYALLGRGRCGRDAESLREAHRLFARLGAAPAAAESERLLAERPDQDE